MLTQQGRSRHSRDEADRTDDSATVSFFVPPDGGWSDRLARRLRHVHPATAALAVTVAAWAVLSVLLISLGLLLTRVLLDGPIGRWDVDVITWMSERRTELLNTMSAWGSRLADTMTIVVATGLLALAFVLRRWWREALLIVLAPTIEVTVFLAVTFLVDRDRPPVEQLDSAPPTSSFPSGHVAAAVAFYGAFALIVAARSRSALLRGIAWAVAVLVPAAVAWSRLYRAMHHPTDVLVGVAGGLACLAAAVLAVRTAAGVAAERVASAEPHLVPSDEVPA